jgi:pimeloyl-ACP methyl ester carboxylesterase
MEERARTRDGRSLHLERSGRGEPMVVFEAGMGAARTMWGAVVPLVAARTTAVVYDRSGLGRSEPDPAPRDLDRLIADHIDLLDHLGAGPFVLVGHSWGGPIIRGVATAVPDRVRGLVLVDQSDEGCDLLFSPSSRRQTRWGVRLAPLLARTGMLRLAVSHLAKQLPEPSASAMRAEDTTPAAAAAFRAELEGSIDDLERWRDHPLELPLVPVSIISGTKASRFERRRRASLVAAHRARAERLPLGRHVVAAGSSHYIPFTEPGVIADEILRLIDQP